MNVKYGVFMKIRNNGHKQKSGQEIFLQLKHCAAQGKHDIASFHCSTKWKEGAQCDYLFKSITN